MPISSSNSCFLGVNIATHRACAGRSTKGGDSKGGGPHHGVNLWDLRDCITIIKPYKEGNVKRPLILLLILSLAVPVLFLGCSGGDDGAAGAAGISTLAAVTNEPSGANCANGGQKGQTGADTT